MKTTDAYPKAPHYLAQNDQDNAGYLYYKDYYKQEDFRSTGAHAGIINLKSKNNALLKLKTRQIPAPSMGQRQVKTFPLKTIYPGLLLGAGYIHEAKLEDSEYKDNAFKLGFYFDYTTGMPVLPGSSVKGVLRSMFPNAFRHQLPKTYREARVSYIQEQLKALELPGTIDIKQLEEEIFAGIGPDQKNKSIYQRDIFLEAVPVSVGQLFETDYITPHKHSTNPKLDPFANPTPNKFLKVLPEVVFEFRFILSDSLLFPQLTADHKAKLFKRILLDIGLGAKTNVGYGQFTDQIAPHQPYEPARGMDQMQDRMDILTEKRPQKPPGKPDNIIRKALKGQTSYEGTLIELGERYAVFHILDDHGHLLAQLVKDIKNVVKKLDKKGYQEALKEEDQFIIFIQADVSPVSNQFNFQVRPPKKKNDHS
ncbi:MAG: type III-B CRISPR module RAMP protein Cmr6 [Bacteroidota bacterium]